MSAAAPGRRNLITDVAGLRVGCAADEAARSGVTVLLCERLTPAGVDVRGGGPGTRETEALAAENSVGAADAVVLSGGSALGLGAADAVAAALSRRGRGVQVMPGHPSVPIVPAAILYDLGPHSVEAFREGPPHPRLARAALEGVAEDFPLGSAGAGRGARAGTLKGGLGSASLVIPGAGAAGEAVTVGALVAANPVGAVTMPGSRVFWAWPFERNVDGVWEYGGLRPGAETARAEAPIPAESKLAGGPVPPGTQTAIGVVATDADLGAAECRRLAMMAQDGLARAIRPSHMPMDGDTIFALATGGVGLGAGGERLGRLSALGSAAADCVARAVARAVYEAVADLDGPPAWRGSA
ncbi:MAG: P1 family peptidase [Pseudomonadota bacterium]